MYLTERTKAAEDKMEAALKALAAKAGLDEEAAAELTDAVKDWVKALVEEEKSDLRDEINKSGMWDPDY